MKRILVIVLMMVLLVTAVGCSDGSGEVPEQQDVEIVTEVSEIADKVAENNQNKDREKQGPADVFGKVSRIVGNEVTIQLIEMPEMSGNTDRSNGQDEGQMRQGGAKQEPKFTGETVQFTIPVGVPISSRSQEGQEELDISEITSGSMIMVWTDEAGQPNRIQLMGAR